MHALSFGLFLLAPLVTGDVEAKSPPQSVVGRQITDFELHDYLGAVHKLQQWSDKKAIVVVFLGTECPVACLAGPRLAELASRYEDKAVAFVGIDSNAQDSLADIAHYAREHKITFPILKDAGNAVADQFGAQRTPDAFVLDGDRVIRYRGMIDNQYGVGYSRPAATSNYVADSLDQLLAGKKVALAETDPAGCYIGRVQRAKGGKVTFSKDVAKVFNQHCVLCHRPNQVGPFSLTAYDEAAGWAETIKEVVSNGRMPPWHADPKYGHFSNDARLTDAEKELIFAWINEGCPPGDAADLPEPPKFAEGWRIPKPDLVLKMPEAFDVPDRGTVPYQEFELNVEFSEDRWIQAAELRPGTAAVVHHLVLYFHVPERVNDHKNPTDVLMNLIAGFAPGMPPAIYAPHSCRRVPAGAKLMIQCHYTPNGTAQPDQSEVGIVFADPKTVKREVSVAAAINPRLRIPPGDPDYTVQAIHKFREDTLLSAVTPHMHLRGRAFRFEAMYPDGSQEILLDVPRYDFSWQNTYDLAVPKLMPEGTEIVCTGHFDNSAGNLANPDPAMEVLWGDQTWEEMMVGTMNISSPEQDLSLGSPRIKDLGDDKFEVEFSYKPAAKAGAVYLAGDFNDWKPDGQRMEGPDSEGRYTAKTQLKAGDYQYKFVLDGRRWRADPGNPDHAGNYRNSLLHVGNKK